MFGREVGIVEGKFRIWNCTGFGEVIVFFCGVNMLGREIDN